MFVICRLNSVTGAVVYLTEDKKWVSDLERALLFQHRICAGDYLHRRFYCTPRAPYSYEVREVN